jgi:hypothetical protein
MFLIERRKKTVSALSKRRRKRKSNVDAKKKISSRRCQTKQLDARAKILKIAKKLKIKESFRRKNKVLQQRDSLKGQRRTIKTKTIINYLILKTMKQIKTLLIAAIFILEQSNN